MQEEPPDNNKMQIFNHLHCRRRDNGHRELQLQWAAVVHILDRQIANGAVRQRAECTRLYR